MQDVSRSFPKISFELLLRFSVENHSGISPEIPPGFSVLEVFSGYFAEFFSGFLFVFFPGILLEFLQGFLTKFLTKLLSKFRQAFIPELLARFVLKISPGVLRIPPGVP